MTLDAFSTQLVHMVRSMTDEALIDLVRNQLGAAFALPAEGRAITRAQPEKRVGRKPGRRRGSPITAAAREATLTAVEKAVKSSKGLSSSEVAKLAGIPQSRAAATLKQLKQEKRIFQGGDRRFARYAGDRRLARTASENARHTASGPIAKGSKRK